METTAGIPGWALIFRSPYDRNTPSKSWIGGLPKAPADFQWPRDESGTPLHFIAQIDCATVPPHPVTGERPQGLPATGSLLFFFAWEACRCVTFGDAAMADATIIEPPSDLSDLKMTPMGFFDTDGEKTFRRWPVDAVPYSYKDKGRPEEMPERFADPADYIRTWGLAAMEAEAAITRLDQELRRAKANLRNGIEASEAMTALIDEALRSTDHVPEGATGGNVEAPDELPILTASDQRQRAARWSFATKYLAQRIEVAAAILEFLPTFLEWHKRASSEPPDDPIDTAALLEFFAARQTMSESTKDLKDVSSLFKAREGLLWNAMEKKYPMSNDRDFDAIPLAYRSFVEAEITDWRGHTLFGIEPYLEDQYTELDGYRFMLKIQDDTFVKTVTEHCRSLSFWVQQDDLAKGRYDDCVFVAESGV